MSNNTKVRKYPELQNIPISIKTKELTYSTSLVLKNKGYIITQYHILYQELDSKGIYLLLWNDIRRGLLIGLTQSTDFVTQTVMDNQFNMSLKLYAILN